jgi:hypothetical protein
MQLQSKDKSVAISATSLPVSQRGTPRRKFLGWLSDFEISGGILRVKKTGAVARVNRELIFTVGKWMRYYAVVRAKVAMNWVLGTHGPQIWFTPETPRPWYMIRSAMAWSGMRAAKHPEQADFAFYFDDSTWSPQASSKGLRAFNFDCRDISKSHVGRIFEQAFGYPLLIDPATHSGPAVEKSEINSLHDGKIIECPRQPRPGYCYQRLVDTSDGDMITDFRTQCIGRMPVLVWIKTRLPTDRFVSIANIDVQKRNPDEIFSAEEISQICKFLELSGLDWGTLDVLRDRNDGRIYIVDANKTDVGPVLNQSMGDKISSTRHIATSLAQLMARATRQGDAGLSDLKR